MRSDRSKNVILFHFIVFIFGFSSILGAVISLDALPLVIYRMLLATLGLGVYFLIFNRKLFQLSQKLWVGVLLGGVVISIHWITFFHAIKIAGVSLTLSMMSTGALLAALLEPLFYKRKIMAYELFFGLLVVVGVGVIFNAEFNQWEGLLIALFSAFLSALFTIINGKLVQQAKAITLSFYQLLIGGLVVLGVAFINQTVIVTPFQLSQWDFLALLVLAWFCTSYAFNASISVMKHLFPYTVMMIINMEPIYGILMAVLFLNEQKELSFPFFIGFTIVFTAIVLNGVFKMRKEKEKPSSLI